MHCFAPSLYPCAYGVGAVRILSWNCLHIFVYYVCAYCLFASDMPITRFTVVSSAKNTNPILVMYFCSSNDISVCSYCALWCMFGFWPWEFFWGSSHNRRFAHTACSGQCATWWVATRHACRFFVKGCFFNHYQRFLVSKSGRKKPIISTAQRTVVCVNRHWNSCVQSYVQHWHVANTLASL